MPMNRCLGIDTSCYTTSAACADERSIVFSKRTMLSVPFGDRGLRQSDGVFQHLKQLAPLLKDLFLECDPMDLVNKGCPDNKVCADRKCVDPSCGDGIKNTSSEECDKNDFGENTCQTEGFASGFLKCSSTCKIDNTNCSGKS